MGAVAGDVLSFEGARWVPAALGGVTAPGTLDPVRYLRVDYRGAIIPNAIPDNCVPVANECPPSLYREESETGWRTLQIRRLNVPTLADTTPSYGGPAYNGGSFWLKCGNCECYCTMNWVAIIPVVCW